MCLCRHCCECLLLYINTRVPTETPSTMDLLMANKSTCPKCGIVKKTGALSCCASGGAWFEKCGDLDDTKFAHTWAEGIRACAGRVSRG